jgi:hypothetical protein
MSNNKSIALEQALVAVICEAKDSGVDIDDLFEKAKRGILGGYYKWVSPDYVPAAIEAIKCAIKTGSEMEVAKK